ncbi:hypothetical protein FACS1894166_03800 [Bacilli bacterium]|nr:hypothetical protein FACS1894166_03800 [Bacilli bacterium]
MCGEMASDILSVPILLGLGLDAFSVSASAILKARKIINSLTFVECQELANEVLTLDTVTAVNDLVKKFLNSRKLYE